MPGSNNFLRLYVNPAWKRGDDVPSPLMFPFWGNSLTENNLFVKELFDSFPFDTTYYTITSDLREADAVFPPYRQAWMLRRYPKLLEECAQVAKEHNLALFVDGLADGEPPLPYDNTYVMRYGGYRFLNKMYNTAKLFPLPAHLRFDPSHRIEVPTQADDLLLRRCGGELNVRQKTEGRPVVGFAGMTWTNYKNMAHIMLDSVPFKIKGLFDSNYLAMQEGILWRRRAIRVLNRSKKIKQNFLLRNFFSGSKSAHGDMRQLQREFIDVVLDSDYALDVRGYGNASVRLYEILSLGRIPVILDTERILPFSDVVDYKKFSLIVDFRDIKRLPDIIADFHASITPEQFEDMQRAAREAFVKYFRTDAQMPHIVQKFNELRAVSARDASK